MLGVFTSMHCLTKFSREAGLTPYLGHAGCLHACYLKSEVTYRSTFRTQPGICVVLSGRLGQRHAQGLCLGSFSFSVT